MERTSSANDLTERLRRRLDSERREIEELTASELARLGEHSRRVARNALHTIERDTEEATGRMRELLLKAWLRPLIVGLSLWMGICAGSWATMRWLATRIQARIETAAELDFDIEEARRTLARMEEDTWGIVLHEIEDERFVVVPEGALADPPWRVDGTPGLEAVERVRELYDRVRGAVDEGLAEVVRAVRDGTAAAIRAGRSLAAARRAAKRGERSLNGSASSGRAGRTKPCRCESSGSTGK